VSPKVRAFLSFIEARFGKPPYRDHPGNPPETAAPSRLSRPAATEAAKPADGRARDDDALITAMLSKRANSRGPRWNNNI
jgi:hypothetical protein